MKLYYAPGACSLSDHIALHQAGVAFEHEMVNLKTKRTESGADFATINPKGYVPALTLDSGETLTENVAILDWIAHQDTALKPSDRMGHTHLLEALAYTSSGDCQGNATDRQAWSSAGRKHHLRSAKCDLIARKYRFKVVSLRRRAGPDRLP